MILGIVVSFPKMLPFLELYVELELNYSDFNSQLNLNSQALVPNQIPESQTRPGTSQNPEPITRPKTVLVHRPVWVHDYLLVPVDAIDDNSLESGDEMLSNESSGFDDDVRPARQS